jgi:DNA polymerase III delta prime subunit
MFQRTSTPANSSTPSLHRNCHAPTFIAKYKPYYVGEFMTPANGETNTLTDTHMVSVLRTLIDIDDLNILFVGNISSGKTTMLYAILREYFGLLQTDTIPETNILFINNLKEQGINYFRNEMKTFCQSLSSIHGKKKVIVIDDIDTVNEQSQQVFRNYIDKYKTNIHFISACSNIQKVIESIQSRLHIITIRSPSLGQIRDYMNRIIVNEGLQIDEPSREFLLEKSNWSIRNVINNLEKIYIYGLPITRDICEQLCSTISFSQFEEYVYHLRERNIAKAINILYDIHDYGYSVIDILEYLFVFVKITQLLSEHEKYSIIPLLCKYITVFHNIHEDCIELALFTNNVNQVLGQFRSEA